MGQIPERSTKYLLLYLINIFCRSLIKLPIYPAVIAQQFKGLQIKQTDGLPVILAVYGTPDLCIKIDSVNGIFVDTIVYRTSALTHKKLGTLFRKKPEDQQQDENSNNNQDNAGILLSKTTSENGTK